MIRPLRRAHRTTMVVLALTLPLLLLLALGLREPPPLQQPWALEQVP